MIKNIIFVYLVIMNIVAFIMYGVDKRKAIKGAYRISEKSLLLVAFLGGAVGAFLGMQIFRHKTKHIRFVVLVPVAIIADAALVIFLFLKVL